MGFVGPTDPISLTIHEGRSMMRPSTKYLNLFRPLFAFGCSIQMVFFGQQEDHRQCPNPADRACDGPELLAATAMFGNYAAENCIEKMHQCRGAPERAHVHFGFDKQQSGEITKQSI